VLSIIQSEWNPFAFSWGQYAIWGGIAAIYLILVFGRKLPSMRTFKDFLDAINSAGGHIFLLSVFSIYFFKVAMQFIYHVLAIQTNSVSKSDAIIMAGITFVTGTAFGGAWGALLKTMTGAKANGATPAPDKLDVSFVPAEESGKK
jgi:hypothetical protein